MYKYFEYMAYLMKRSTCQKGERLCAYLYVIEWRLHISLAQRNCCGMLWVVCLFVIVVCFALVCFVLNIENLSHTVVNYGIPVLPL